MKNKLATAVALGLAACAVSSPAIAADHHNNHSRYERQHNGNSHRVWSEHNYYGNNYDRRFRGNSYYHWRYFYRYPSYYEGYGCDRRYNVIVRDPYTLRYVCMPRYDYDRYNMEIRINL